MASDSPVGITFPQPSLSRAATYPPGFKQLSLVEQGFYCLQAARNSGFLQTAYLQQAYGSFKEALQTDTSSITPRLGLVYVLMLLGDTKAAQAMLQEAESYAPEHPDIPTLKALLHEQSKGQNHTVRTALEVDTLADQLQRMIHSKVRYFNQLLTQIHTHSQPLSQQEAIKAANDLLTKQIHKIQACIRLIDEDRDTIELWRACEVLSRLHNRFQALFSQSEQLFQLLQQIQTAAHQTEQWLTALEQPIGSEESTIIEQQLEQMMDQCDQVADQLDAWESKGVVDAVLVASYEKWVHQLTLCHDLLEERG